MATLKKSAKKTAAKKPALKSSAKSGIKSAAAKFDAAKLNQLPQSLVGSAQQIWMAGMGAFQRAQGEGSKLFEALVKEGMSIEQSTRKLATGKVDAVRDAMEDRVSVARERAADTWDRLEKVFEDRVQRALTRLNVPGREELVALTERVQNLTSAVKKEAGKVVGKSSAKKPAAKKAPAKKPAAKKAKVSKPVVKAAKKAAKPAKKAIKRVVNVAAPEAPQA